VTNTDGTVVTEQWTLPFGNTQPFTAIPGGENPYQHPTLSNPSKKRFTSYDRSDATGLDYAVNRFYSSQQGRFAQVDPIEMAAVSLGDPQSLNLYCYVGNDPVNYTDPMGLSPHPPDYSPRSGHCSAQYNFEQCGGLAGIMRGNFGNHVAEYNREYGGMSAEMVGGLRQHNERVANAVAGQGYRTSEEIAWNGTFRMDLTIYKDGKKIVSVNGTFDIMITIRPGPPTAEDYIAAISLRAPQTEWFIEETGKAALGIVLLFTGGGLGGRGVSLRLKGVAKIEDILLPGGKALGQAGSKATIRELKGGMNEAQSLFNQMTQGGKIVPSPTYPGTLVQLPNGGTVGLRTVATRSPGTAVTIDVNISSIPITKIKFNP
jgi:RHS repeat-associated protein